MSRASFLKDLQVDGKHWTWRFSQHRFRDAAHEHAAQCGSAVGRHHDQIRIALLREAEDFASGIAIAHMDFDRAGEIRRHQLTQFFPDRFDRLWRSWWNGPHASVYWRRHGSHVHENERRLVISCQSAGKR